MAAFWVYLLGFFGGGLGFIVALYCLLCCLGFTCAGIGGGSVAAGLQSGIGNVAGGSCFACFQSAGAGGMSLGYHLLLFAIGAALTLYLIIHFDQQNLTPDTGNTTFFDFFNGSSVSAILG